MFLGYNYLNVLHLNVFTFIDWQQYLPFRINGQILGAGEVCEF